MERALPSGGTSITSTTGNPTLPRATADANAVLMPRPAGADLDPLVAHGVRSVPLTTRSWRRAFRSDLQRRRRERIRLPRRSPTVPRIGR